MSGAATTWRGGGCHCGAVRFEADLPNIVEAQTCNCSICAMTGFLHVIVSESRFRLVRGSEHLTSYTFNTHTARHLFCDICGVKSFYRPRSNPDGWSLNAHCLDASTAPSLSVTAFDGQNWERHGAELAHLSKEVP